MIGRYLEVRDIELFLTLAEELHFSRSAERLGLTPSRVSQRLRGVEDRLGLRLFERTSRKVVLTAAGATLRHELEPAYQQILRAVTHAHQMAPGPTGSLRVGVYTPGPNLVKIIGAFEGRHPACRVRLISCGSARDPVDWLRSDDVDILLSHLPLPADDIVVGPILNREQRVLIVASDHALAHNDTVCYEDLVPYIIGIPPGKIPLELLDALIPPFTPNGKRIRRVKLQDFDEFFLRIAKGESVWPDRRSAISLFDNFDVTAIPFCDLPPSESALIWLHENNNVKVLAFADAATAALGDNKPLSRDGALT